ncbi:unnamed protein product [Medioppia subpectinata]|uniref:Uncharacterized protein n=1 Tax=Medioppia subpectinata TaxID=1979941 RepID=A0A7R9Q0L3_9ACAR|nr:unnamed protein product [Medioppia subpectinata]CAG2108207.1 unnamed protein product [Medioppia subpectinata]
MPINHKTNNMNYLLQLVALLALTSSVWSACELKWIKTDHKNLPPDSVLVIANNPAGDFYVSRAVYNGVLTPGRYKPAEETCFVTMDGHEYGLRENFEVLTNPNKCFLDWKKAHDGTVPKGAVESGKDPQGGVAYSARLHEWFGWMVGKMYKSTNKMYYGWGGGENVKTEYEILVLLDQAPDHTLHPSCANHKQFDHDISPTPITITTTTIKPFTTGFTPRDPSSTAGWVSVIGLYAIDAVIIVAVIGARKLADRYLPAKPAPTSTAVRRYLIIGRKREKALITGTAATPGAPGGPAAGGGGPSDSKSGSDVKVKP